MSFALLFLDGCLEEDRNRIDNLIAIQKSHKKERQMDLIDILNKFLHMGDPGQDTHQKDTAAKICIMLIEACGYDSFQQKATDFHNWFHATGLKSLSVLAQSFVITYLVKINELASEFYDMNGIKILMRMLHDYGFEDQQLTYNVLISLWILSYHDYARKDFEDLDQMLIEKLLKVLDYFTKEKVVRAFLLLFDSLSSSKKCLEIMSDLSCTEIFSRLQQRNWAEKESVEMLDNLWELLD